MNNEEKALKIAVGTVGERTRNHPSNIPHIICVKDACLEMAAWKEQQMIEMFSKFLKDEAQKFVLQTPLYNYFDYKKAIERFKQAMEE